MTYTFPVLRLMLNMNLLRQLNKSHWEQVLVHYIPDIYKVLSCFHFFTEGVISPKQHIIDACVFDEPVELSEVFIYPALGHGFAYLKLVKWMMAMGLVRS